MHNRFLLSTLVAVLCAPHPAASPARAAQPRLVIVAPARFHAALADFARHKRESMAVGRVSLAEALKDSQGVDDPERFKRFRWRSSRGRRAGYALLVGDA